MKTNAMAAFLLMLFSCRFFLFAQTPASKNTVQNNSLTFENATWRAAAGGTALLPPKNTSYGFAVLTDGRMICACTSNGKTLWEKPVKGRPDPYLTVFSNDFLLTVSDGKTVSLVNPSGLTLWSVDAPFTIVENPTVGRDGRIFVKGKENAACYGVNGIMKWSAVFPPLREIPFLELNDGSIFALKSDTQNGKSVGIRFDPFGNLLEEITFTGFVANAFSCADGVLLVFSGGGAGLCAVDNGATYTKWAIPNDSTVFLGITEMSVYFAGLSEAQTLIACPLQFGIRIIIVENSSGQILQYFDINEIDAKNISCVSSSQNGTFFVADESRAFLYEIDGNLLWAATLPPKNATPTAWNYLSYTKTNHLVVCTLSWVISGWRTIQSVSAKDGGIAITQKKDYSAFYNINAEDFSLFSFMDKIGAPYVEAGRKALLEKGGYGGREAKIGSALLSFSAAYIAHLATENAPSRKKEISIFERDSVGVDEILQEISLLGTDSAQQVFASILKAEQNSAHLNTLIHCISMCGYDPRGEILAELDVKLATISSSQSATINAICDAVYEICRFMGRPAFYSRGNRMLTKLLSRQYSSSVREHARETLERIAALGL